MNATFLLITILSCLIAVGAVIFLVRKISELKKLQDRFKGVVDIDKEIVKVSNDLKQKTNEHQNAVAKINSQITELRSDYAEKRKVFDRLMGEITVLEEDLEYISYGMYKPHFDFDTSEKYKTKLIETRQKQKQAIKDKQAAVCAIEWSVEGSKAKGRTMVNRQIKLTLRAFNNECDSAILKVRWNNVQKMEERIRKAFDALNKLGETNQISITGNYLQLKHGELHLAHEYQEKLYDEKEEQRRIKEQIREEEKVQKEIEKATKAAEDDEKRYQNALLQAQSDLESAHGDELQKLNDQMKELQQKLKEAQELKERAVSRAQLTKSGHVYIISNIGSFGEEVYKIGLTRRLEPFDRVKELGDASVPFAFDVHGMIFSENAPELENKLHNAFNEFRLNLVNKRKEYFNVSLNDIEKIVKENDAEMELTKLAEAKEYRETLAIREQHKIDEQRQVEIEEKFPQSL